MKVHREIYTKGTLMNAYGRETDKQWEVADNGHGTAFSCDENVLKLILVMVAQLNILKTIKSYT